METPLIVGALVLAAVWGVYLLPTLFSEKATGSINSTEEFDRWTHSMAHVQKHTAAALAAQHKDQIRLRRRRTIGVLGALAAGCLVAAFSFKSMGWLLGGLFFASLIGLYGVVLAQVKKQRLERLKVTHVSERPSEWDEPQVRVIAN